MTGSDSKLQWHTRRLAALLLLALAGVQLAVASHQFEHDASNLGGACAVCVQIESLDGAVSAPDSGLPPLAAADPIAVQSLPVEARRTEAGFDSRAPPRY